MPYSLSNEKGDLCPQFVADMPARDSSATDSFPTASSCKLAANSRNWREEAVNRERMSAACKLGNMCLVKEHGKEVLKKDKEYLKGFQNKGERGSSKCNRSIGGVTKIVNLMLVIHIHKTIFSTKEMIVDISV